MILWPKEILERLEEIREELKHVEHFQHLAENNLRMMTDLLADIVYRQNAAHVVEITQDGEQMGQLTGTAIGGTSNFTALFLQGAGGAAGTLQAGNIPAWKSSDANVAITASKDGTQASVALGAGETAATYDLTVSAINSDGNPISNTFTIPVLPAVVVPPPPPPDTAATFVDLVQNS